MTNKCTIISQINTLLHVSTLSCHPQGTFNHTSESYTSISNAAVGNTIHNANCVTKSTIYNKNQFNQYLANLHRYFKCSCWQYNLQYKLYY